MGSGGCFDLYAFLSFRRSPTGGSWVLVVTEQICGVLVIESCRPRAPQGAWQGVSFSQAPPSAECHRISLGRGPQSGPVLL